METLITAMIFLGSAVMVWNIVRFAVFIRQSHDLEQHSGNWGMLIAPLVLMVFFLLGYVSVGVLGLADLLIAAILLGGSVFVFIFLSLMLSIVKRARDTDRVLSARYEEMKEELEALTKGDNATFRINLTKDEVEERHGQFLYDTDLTSLSYTELLEGRRTHVIDIDPLGDNPHSLISREDLLRAYEQGRTRISEVVLVRRSDGDLSFVRLDATLTKKPVSGEVIAFLVEYSYNDQVVRRMLLEKVMMDQYDRIVYLSNGVCRVLISNVGKKDGLLFSDDETASYESLYLNVILPPLIKPRGRATDHPLRLSAIDRALSEQDTYVVEQLFRIGGEIRRKRFSFYCIDRKAKFYLMLLSDTTANGELVLPEDGEKTAPEQPEAEPEPVGSENAATDALFGEGRRVLVVDDNEMNREIAELMLSSEGWTVELAADGAEAVERIAAAEPGHFDLVLMDVNMPVMGGYEATAAIRALDPGRAGVPIVALSASDAEEDMRKALAEGMDAYAAKPLDPDQIRETAERLLAGK